MKLNNKDQLDLFQRSPLDNQPIEKLNLPTRITNVLKKIGMKTVADLVGKDKQFFLNIEGFGMNAFRFLNNTLEQRDEIFKNNNEKLVDKNIKLPPSLSFNDPLEVLGFPVRLENSLRRGADIISVGQFCNTTDEELIQIRNIGPKSVNYLLKVKNKIIYTLGNPESNDVNEEIGEIQDASPEPITEKVIPKNQLVSLLLERCGNDRAKEVITRRYGLINGERQTLEEIGEFYGVTRERIRQIQAKALKQMRHPITSVKKPLVELIEGLLYQNGGILTDEEADSKIPELLEITTEDGSSLLDLLCDLGWVQSCKAEDLILYSPRFGDVSLESLSEKIINLIKAEDLGLDVISIVKRVSLFRKITDTRFNPSDFVLRYCLIDPRIEEVKLSSGNETVFRHYTSGHFATKGWAVLMKRVLEEEQMPLHFTEITNRVNDLMGNGERQLDVRRAHSIMIENEAFAHSGVNGTYGLTSWGLRKELTPQLIEECMRKAGFPLHWRQIYNYVSKYKNTKPGNITACLETNKMFKRVESGVYWLSE